VLAGWVIVAAVAVPLAGRLTEVQKNDLASFLPASAESTRVLALQERFRAEETFPAVVVYERRGGLTSADRAAAAAQRAAFVGVSAVTGEVPPPVPSADGQAITVVVPLSAEDDDAFVAGVVELRRIAEGRDGLAVYVAGPAGTQADLLEVFADIDTTLLLATLVVVVVILLLTYRSPVLWIIPVVSAGLSLQLAQAVNYLLAKYAGLTVNGQSAGILLVLVFGAGTDYALLLVARYREELRRHQDRYEAMAFALTRAGPAILASAATVIGALLCLLASQLNSNRGLGPVSAVGIACALLAMVTLLPALLVVTGRWIFWPFVPRFGSPPHEESGVWGRTGRAIAARPRPVWVGTGLLLGALALGGTQLDAAGISNAEAFRGKPESVQGQEALARHFDAGSGSPAVVIGRAEAAEAISAVVRDTPGVAAVAEPRVVGDYVQVEATLADAADSVPATQTVELLRGRVDTVEGGQALVGGDTAINDDVQRASAHDNRLIIPLILAVVSIILVLLLRALVAPVLLTATVVLSFLATLGACGLAFRYAFGFAGQDTSFPLFAFVFLVALGIDYNIFLTTRVREETWHLGTRAGVLKGLAVTGGVITSAGVVLAATFSVLGVLPLVVLTQLGFAVAFGVLLDTLVVRSILVPALALDLGSRIWWPSRLDRGRARHAAGRHRQPAPVGAVPR
jgi:putative drug exporter of the RND superfamily